MALPASTKLLHVIRIQTSAFATSAPCCSRIAGNSFIYDTHRIDNIHPTSNEGWKKVRRHPVFYPAHDLYKNFRPVSLPNLWDLKYVNHTRINIPGRLAGNVGNRRFATSSLTQQQLKENKVMPSEDEKPGKDRNTKTVEAENAEAKVQPELDMRGKLKQAVKDYGKTVIVFHVTMSLGSVAFFYMLVSSGLDVVSFLENLGVGKAILESKVTAGASTFLVAYAVHKVFAPVRIAITLSVVPFLVRYLRRIGVLK